MRMTAYVVSQWGRGEEGNEPEVFLDAKAHGWKAEWKDVTDQTAENIDIGHGIVVEVKCDAETLKQILAFGHRVIPATDERLLESEAEALSKYLDKGKRLPRNATGEIAKNLLVTRFKAQGFREDINDVATKMPTKDVREVNANISDRESALRLGKGHCRNC
jgi:hypothetical protein